MQIGRENVGIFVNGPVLNNAFTGLLQLFDALGLAKATIEEIDLEVEGPAGHIVVKILQIRIIVYVFQKHFPAEMLSQFMSQRGFTGPNVADDGNVHALRTKKTNKKQNLKGSSTNEINTCNSKLIEYLLYLIHFSTAYHLLSCSMALLPNYSVFGMNLART